MRTRLALGAILLAAMAVLTGCPQQRSIADVVRSPGRYADQDVTIAGTVSRSFGALGTGIYEVDDGTGKMWVYSAERNVPGQGEKLAVTGRVVPTMTFAGKSFATVLRERDRHYKR